MVCFLPKMCTVNSHFIGCPLHSQFHSCLSVLSIFTVQAKTLHNFFDRAKENVTISLKSSFGLIVKKTYFRRRNTGMYNLFYIAPMYHVQ